MKEEIRQHLNTALHGLIYAADSIDQALIGKKRPLDAQMAEHDGPFAQALARIAEIADGGPITDPDQVRADLHFLFSLLHHLRGGFYSALWDILAPAHERVADLVTEAEARTILGDHAYWLDLETRLGHVHPFERRDGTWRVYDATYLRRSPDEANRYARYELEACKRKLDFSLKNKQE